MPRDVGTHRQLRHVTLATSRSPELLHSRRRCSCREGFGTVALEVNARGLPVLNSTQYRRHLIVPKQNGYVFTRSPKSRRRLFEKDYHLAKQILVKTSNADG